MFISPAVAAPVPRPSLDVAILRALATGLLQDNVDGALVSAPNLLGPGQSRGLINIQIGRGSSGHDASL
ncbi:hypothetical protein ONS95_012851 [Cadophora gregata]|uniref:uncharacterized protein n=1 Tax=Cadophora gregata TaxID=51156 RepID=UPI0026DBE634|nr:uncharacterized protein ONS95_012851 [Cadophora gregata]KAK0115800.1 hypothetical protein ONS95_012851 [Cadophora gregata]